MSKIICPICETPLDSSYKCPECKKDFSEEVEFNYFRGGELTERQIAQQDFVDNACYSLLRMFEPQAEYDGKEIGIIRDALIEVLCKYHNWNEYDIYPWLLEPIEPENCNFTPLQKKVIETNNDEVLVVRTKLTEKVDVEEYSPMSAEVIFSHGSIEVKVPKVETYGDPPGEAIPILVEQAGGKLFLRAWDETEEDPVINKSWERKEVTT